MNLFRRCKQLHGRHRKDTFYNAVRPVIIGARICGIMPISGAFSQDARRLKFKWLSLPSMTSAIVMAWIGLNAVLGLRIASQSGFGLQNAGKWWNKNCAVMSRYYAIVEALLCWRKIGKLFRERIYPHAHVFHYTQSHHKRFTRVRYESYPSGRTERSKC